MKNLVCLGQQHFQLPFSASSKVCYNPRTREHIAVTDDGTLLVFADNKKPVSHSLPFQLSSPLSFLRLLLDENIIFITTKNGDLILLKEDFETFEIVGQVDGGVLMAAWSPNEQVLCLASSSKFIALTRDFSLISEKEWRVNDISWRPDSEFCVLNMINPEKSVNELRVLDASMNTIAVSEAVVGLSDFASWKSSGELIASSAKESYKHEIVFYEKNGLRHGEFEIDLNDNVNGMSWSSDGQLFALHTQRESGIESIRIYHRSNYYWSVKYEIVNLDFQEMYFSTDNPLQFYYITQSGFAVIDFDWKVFVCQPKTSCTTIVIDGSKLKFTSFTFSNVPPPMSHFELKLTHSVIALSSYNETIAALDCTGHVTLIEYKTAMKLSESVEPKILNIVKLAERLAYLDILLIESDKFLTVGLRPESFQYSLDSYHSSGSEIKSIASIFTNNPLMSFTADDELSNILVQDFNGKFQQVCLEPLFLNHWSYAPSQSLRRVWTCLIMENCQPTLLSLCSDGSFYVHDAILLRTCNSFYMHPQFLILSTTDHHLHFFPKSVSPHNWKLLLAQPSEESVRRTERGTKIVLACPSTAALVLQMPRGNLETIYPRALVISQIRNELARLEYRSAFLQARKHRVDLNLLVDYNLVLFSENIAKFVAEVDRVDYLNQFITSLRNEDVTIDIFKGFKITDSEDKKTTISVPVKKEKVNNICKRFVKTLESLDPVKYIETIITAFVRQNPPQISSALSRIAELSDPELFENTLNYLIFLVDPNTLYKSALALYNFKMALAIAQNSQMDPKQYGPFLTELQAMEKNYCLFKVHDFIEKPKEAVKYIAASENRFEEAMEYIKKHDLYKEALAAYQPLSLEYTAVMLAYAEVLIGKQEYERAALAFKIGGQVERAMTCYQQAGKWQEAFALAKQIPISEAKITNMASSLKDRLIERRRFDEAAVVALDYLNDLSMAVDILIAGNQWFEALRICTKVQKLEMIAERIEPALSKSYFQMLNEISEQVALFDKHYTRLTTVREEKKAKKKAEEEMIESGDLEIADIQSETEMSFFTSKSKTSMGSRSSTRSKRKAQNKPRLRAREGGRYEEEYLMTELSLVIKKFIEFKADVKSFSKALAWFSKLDFLDTIDLTYTSAWYKLCDESTIEDIFTSDSIHEEIPPIERPAIPSLSGEDTGHKLFFKE